MDKAVAQSSGISRFEEKQRLRSHVLAEIRRLAEENGGIPLGSRAFERCTGVREATWRGVLWARWSEAVAEAGFSANTAPPRIEDEFLLRKLAEACRHFWGLPTNAELRLYRDVDPSFPGAKTIARRFRTKTQLLERLVSWSHVKEEFADVAAMLATIEPEPEKVEAERSCVTEGSVYLIRSGAHYKIGRSDQLERRIKEIRIALPDKATLVHTIRTDDPSGIEAYWHRRFADRRANGEWFRLTASDVAAFKRRKFQ